MEIQSQRVTRDSLIYEKVLALYEAAFPVEERAPLDMLVDGKDWNGDFRAYFADGIFAGLAFNYVDDRFCYLFYLAVEPSMRRHGVGTAILNNITESYPDRSLILEMEELDSSADNYAERLQRSRFYQNNGLKLTEVHNTQCGVPYHVLCADPTITLNDYKRMWRNIVRIQGYSEEDGSQWLERIFGKDFVK